MNNLSVTISGIMVAFLVPVFVQYGFSEGCSSELVNVLSPLPGLVIAYIGRKRHGDIDAFGFKTPKKKVVKK